MTLISGAETQPVVRFHLSQFNLKLEGTETSAERRHQGLCKVHSKAWRAKRVHTDPKSSNMLQFLIVRFTSLQIVACSFFQKDIEAQYTTYSSNKLALFTFILKLPAAVNPESKQQVIRTNIGFIDLQHNASHPSHGWKVHQHVPWSTWMIVFPEEFGRSVFLGDSNGIQRAKISRT